jgi:hypothetical protein
MELSDRDAIDLTGPADLQIGTDGSGTLRFLAVEGDVDGRHIERDSRPAVQSSWPGVDECDQASGRGGQFSSPTPRLRLRTRSCRRRG